MKTSATIKSFYTINPKKVSAPTPPVAVKAHFGNYIAQFKNTNLSTVVSELTAYPAFRGWQVRYNPRDLEGDFGNYSIGFAAIDAVLALLPPDKRLIILLEFKSIDQTTRENAEHVVPDYMLSPTYDGGEFLYDSTNDGNQTGVGPGAGGYQVKMLNANVRNRLAALAQALGERYNNHPQFEGIGVVEAAFQNPMVTLPTDWYDQQWIGLIKWAEALKLYLPNCFVYMFINYLRSHLDRAINGGVFGSVSAGQYNFVGLKNAGIGMGGPNTLPNEYGLGGYDSTKTPPVIGGNTPGVYSYYDDMSNQIPLCPSQQRPDFLATNLAKNAGSHVPTVEEVLNYARDNLFANYRFITRATASGSNPDSWATVKAYYDANPSLKNDVTGGLNTAKPACYAAMKTD